MCGVCLIVGVSVTGMVCVTVTNFYRQLDFPSEPGVASEILEFEPNDCLAVP